MDDKKVSLKKYVPLPVRGGGRGGAETAALFLKHKEYLRFNPTPIPSPHGEGNKSFVEVACHIPVYRTFDYLLPEAFSQLDPTQLMGRRVKIPFGYKSSVGVICGVKETSDSPAAKLKAIAALLDEEPLLSPEMVELGRWLSRRTVCSLGEALFSMLPPGKDLSKSILNTSDKSHFVESTAGASAYHLSEEQKSAAGIIHEAIYTHAPRSFLLYGVAAAGKTEVYMAAIRDALGQGKTVLYLTPEISLSFQIVDVLKERFGDEAVLHYRSDVSTKVRAEEWWKIKTGHTPIVVGSRSAILSPLPNCGLIIIDEEHDAAYKEDRKPRFHVRDVAMERARLTNATVIFGSATPSLEIYHEAKEGRVTLIALHERVVVASKPTLQLIDLAKEKPRGILAPRLKAAVEARLAKKEQTILFLNKRGFHRYLFCTECTWVANCPNCAIVLVRHKTPPPTPAHLPRRQAGKGRGMIVESFCCHYCSYQLAMPVKCPSCQEKKLVAGGYGTQRVMEDVQREFPWARLLRWDRDAVLEAKSQEKVFRDFQEGDFDILVGTQMVAHGFNFPRVTLVGLLDVDGPLHRPDFRSAERTFQMITQVAGRAGRALVTGDVFIQTRSADHYALAFALKGDVMGFFEKELKFREELFYPPFTHLIQVATLHKNSKRAEGEMAQFMEWLTHLNLKMPVTSLGPTLARGKLKGTSQLHVLLKIPRESFDEFLIHFRIFLEPRVSGFSVDVDPQSVK